MKQLLFVQILIALFIIPVSSNALEKQNPAEPTKINDRNNQTIDSLLLVLKTQSDDTNKIKTLIDLASRYTGISNYDMAIQYSIMATEIADKTGDKKLISRSLRKTGNIYANKLNYEKAIEYYLASLKTAEEDDYQDGMANSLNNLGNMYLNLAMLSNSEINFQKSLEFHHRAMDIRKKIHNYKDYTSSLLNISNVYQGLGQQEKAIEYLLQALKEYTIEKEPNGIDLANGNLGSAYLQLAKKESRPELYTKAEEYYSKVLNKENTSHRIEAYISMGEIRFHQNRLNEAGAYLTKGMEEAKKIKSIDYISNAAILFAELMEKKGDYKQAMQYHKLYTNLKDTLLNGKSSKQIAEMNTKYDSEKKDKQLIKKDAEISKQQAETEKQNLQRNAFIIGFALVLVLAFFIFRGYRQKKNANKLLEEKNILIENQKQLVEEKNIKITDSINYAKRIQQAILPSQEMIKTFFPESFIFFRPKDIVSGDFYWFSEKGGKLIIVAADCTGHGVPGAFMSMIGNTLLNEIINVKNILVPAKILNELNKGIVHLLNQDSNDSTTQDDGMDITIIAIDKTTQEIDFAGANHFSYLFNNSELKILKGDVFSIGGMFGRSDINFASQKIKIEKDSTIYLFTDGFVDQFGGEKNTKFLSSRFETLLQTLQQKDMENQKESLIKAFDDWKADNKQLDDVLVMGIKI